MKNKFFQALNIQSESDLKAFAKATGIKASKLKYYADEAIYPQKKDLNKILSVAGLTELEFQLRVGILNNKMKELLASHAQEIAKILSSNHEASTSNLDEKFEPVFTTSMGTLYQADCIKLMRTLPKESVDLVFADPPFNLDKDYKSGINDKRSKQEYLEWTEEWVLGCVDLLKEGGSLFIWNLPLWNTHISEILNKHLTFRHWIAVDIKYRLPIPNKLYPSHYSLLYYVKGDKPATFHGERRPLDVCRHCGGDIRDYGGYKDKLNINGINLSDVWYDIPPVRHSKYKTRTSNELPIKLLERVISMATNEGDVVFDPFGGSGTTYITSEILGRRWIGCEIGPVDTIKARFDEIEFHKELIRQIQKEKNILFSEETKKLREKNNYWLPETLKIKRRNGDTEAGHLEVISNK
jgi:site-specific DNA-methyltransferase (adenine-specific)